MRLSAWAHSLHEFLEFIHLIVATLAQIHDIYI